MRTSTLPIQRFVFAAIICVVVAYSSAAQTGRDIARNAFPSVVLIVAENTTTHESTLGSGFFVRGDLIVTNYHVVRGASKITVKLFGGGAEYDAESVAFSAAKDVAILKVASVLARPLPLGDVNDVGVGDEVYAIGNPEGLEATISQGIVSGIRQIAGNRLFQITAAVSHGSSGGPVLGKSGEVIGIAVGSLSSGQNLNFAIPASEAVTLINQVSGEDAVLITPRVPKSTSPNASPKVSVFKTDKIDSAIEKVRAQPVSAAAHFELAEAFRLVARDKAEDEVLVESAIQEYKRVIQIDPRFHRAYAGLAESYLLRMARRTDKIDDPELRKPIFEAALAASMEANKQAIRLDPDFVDAHVGLCRDYALLERFDDAIAECRLAIRIDPASERAFRFLGAVYKFAERYDEAVRAYQSAARLNPNSDSIYYYIAEIYVEAKRYDRAIINYQRSIRLNSTDAFDSLVDCYVKARRISEGISYFSRLISILGTDRIGDDGQSKTSQAHHALGMLYARSRNRKAALKQYKILKLQGSGHPESEPAKLAEKLFNVIYK